MGSSTTKFHKLVWSKLLDDVAPVFVSWGFGNHPLWEPGWDRYNQDYTAHFVHEDFSTQIREATILYTPAYKQINVQIHVFPNKEGLNDISSFHYDADSWITYRFRNGWTKFSLNRSSRWNFFGPHTYAVKHQKDDYQRNNIEKVIHSLLKNLPLLKSCVFADAQNWKVSVMHHSGDPNFALEPHD